MSYPAVTRAVNPPRLQILRIDGEGMIDDIIMHGTWRHCEKNVPKRCYWNCNIWPNWFTSYQSLLRILQRHTRFCEKMFDVNSKVDQINKATYLKFHCQKVESTRNGKLWRLSRRYQTLIWRPGETVQNLESPRLSGRVDSPESLTSGTWVGFVNREVLHQHLLGKSLSPPPSAFEIMLGVIICLAF